MCFACLLGALAVFFCFRMLSWDVMRILCLCHKAMCVRAYMWMFILLCMYPWCVCMHVNVCMRIYLDLCAYMCMYVYVCVCVYLCAGASSYNCVLRIHMCPCECQCSCVHMHVYACTMYMWIPVCGVHVCVWMLMIVCIHVCMHHVCTICICMHARMYYVCLHVCTTTSMYDFE